MIRLTGIPFVPGVVTGPALVPATQPRRAANASGPHGARDRIAAARRAAEEELSAGVTRLPDGPAREILRAHLALLADPALGAATDAAIADGCDAAAAVDRAASSLTARFAAFASPALRSRAADVRDVCDAIARHLDGDDGPELDADAIVCAVELSPAQVLRLMDRKPRGFVLGTAVAASHAAILIRALGVPAVIGVAAVTSIAHGTPLVVDGSAGAVVVNPDATTVPGAVTDGAAVERDGEPARTLDGVAIAVTASIGDAAEAARALASGADGIGLCRTEWLFLRGETLPTEDQQCAAYRAIAAAAGGRPVVMRTIDLGGDKPSPALTRGTERNPALGLRGVRLAFAYPDVMRTQLRALARAFEATRLRLLLPMVNDLDDVRSMRELMADAGITADRCEIGVMIETPAAAVMAADLAQGADFLSLGTNDLTQYVLAVDRDQAATSPLYEPLHPAVLRLMRGVAAAAAIHRRPLSVCGEIAGDPIAAPLLVGMGVTELSVPPAAVPRVKRLIRNISAKDERAVVEELTRLPTAAAVTSRLREIRVAEAPSRCTASS